MSEEPSGIDNVHPLGSNEIRSLRQLRRENIESRYVFITELGGPATTAGFLKMITRTGEAAKLPVPVHPYMHVFGAARPGLYFNRTAFERRDVRWLAILLKKSQCRLDPIFSLP